MKAEAIEGLSGAPVAHVVNISSDAIYADGPVPLTEATPVAPTSLHGAMHLAREIALHAEVRVPLAMLRPTLIYGAADPHAYLAERDHLRRLLPDTEVDRIRGLFSGFEVYITGSAAQTTKPISKAIPATSGR